jgi:Skp family chaperone for outer membrane proteins
MLSKIKFRNIAAVGAAMLLMAAVMDRNSRAADPAGGSSPSIAIANVQKIFDSIHESADMNSQMQLDAKALQQADTDKVNNLKAMQAALTYLNNNAPQYQEQQEKYVNARIEYEVWAKEQQMNLERTQKEHMKAVFTEIQQAIAQVAQKDGISLVIDDERPQIPDNLEDITVQDLTARISQRTILFSDQSRDISGEVITLMDRNYAAKTSSPNGPGLVLPTTVPSN